MNKPLISFIVPVYNTPVCYLKQCINSILNIKKIDYELIIVNDGSTIDSVNNCLNSYKTFKNVSVIEKSGGGSHQLEI